MFHRRELEAFLVLTKLRSRGCTFNSMPYIWTACRATPHSRRRFVAAWQVL